MTNGRGSRSLEGIYVLKLLVGCAIYIVALKASVILSLTLQSEDADIVMSIKTFEIREVSEIRFETDAENQVSCGLHYFCLSCPTGGQGFMRP